MMLGAGQNHVKQQEWHDSYPLPALFPLQESNDERKKYREQEISGPGEVTDTVMRENVTVELKQKEEDCECEQRKLIASVKP